MKKGVMFLLMLAGLTATGALQAMDNPAAERGDSAGYSGVSDAVGDSEESPTSGAFHENGYGNPGSVSPGISDGQPSLEDIRKTLKGYRSINRKTYPFQLMELV